MSYVGQSVRSLEYRKSRHINDALNHKDNIHFHNALRYYGPENFVWDVIEECDNIDELNRLEIYYIGFFDTYNNGYNLTKGGSGKVGWNPTEETRQKMSEATRGEKNPMFGKHPGEETKRKMSKAKKGKYNGRNNPRSRSIVLTHPDGEEEQFSCTKYASDKYDLTYHCLTRVARGKRNHHKGYKCRYV